MRINNENYQTIWFDAITDTVKIIDQRILPHKFEIVQLNNLDDVKFAIKNMLVRGAPLIGVTAAYGIYLAIKNYSQGIEIFDEYIQTAATELKQTRPTAVNLEWAVNRSINAIKSGQDITDKLDIAFKTAQSIEQEDIKNCEKIGEFGAQIIEAIYRTKKSCVNILTHCNAGWLATVNWGTALAPIYKARDMGVDLHIWVDETRPRNQGASLTAFELLNENIFHTLISDNTGGHLMQNGLVDLVIVGADRVAKNGDTANKIGTYLKALAAKDNNIPFYVALPTSTIDNSIESGKNISIEVRDMDEVLYISGLARNDEITDVLIAPKGTPAINYGFDVTPARLITAMITENGIVKFSM